MNGKAGDHPLTDILIHGLPAFSPEVDALIKEINEPVAGGMASLFRSSFSCCKARQLRENGRDADVDALLHNFAWTLRGERDRFK